MLYLIFNYTTTWLFWRLINAFYQSGPANSYVWPFQALWSNQKRFNCSSFRFYGPMAKVKSGVIAYLVLLFTSLSLKQEGIYLAQSNNLHLVKARTHNVRSCSEWRKKCSEWRWRCVLCSGQAHHASRRIIFHACNHRWRKVEAHNYTLRNTITVWEKYKIAERPGSNELMG